MPWNLQRLGLANPAREPDQNREPLTLIDRYRAHLGLMYPEDVGPDSRTSSPSITERMRSIATRRSFASSPYGLGSRGRTTESSHDEESDRSRESSQQGFSESLRRPPSLPEPVFREHAVQALDRIHSQDKRAEAVYVLAKDIGFYSGATQKAIIIAADDLGHSGASLKARRAFFSLLEVIAIHLKQPLDNRLEIFEYIVVEVDGKGVHYQVKALRALTKDGSFLSPFEADYAAYLARLLPKQYLDASAARKKNRGDSNQAKLPGSEERGLHSLLDLVADTFKMSSATFDNVGVNAIIKETIQIAEKTISKRDMSKAVGILRATAEHAGIPPQQLRQCLEVLCAISNAITEQKQATLDCIFLLLRSPDQKVIVENLLETLALAPNDRHSHTVGGALTVLCRLVSDGGNPDLPAVTFPQLIDALDEVHFASRRTRRDCLKAISTLLRDQNLTNRILSSNWEHLVKIILTATGDENYIHDKTSDPLTIRAYLGTHVASDTTFDETALDRSLADDITDLLNTIAALFNPLWLRLTPEQRQLVSLFYFKLRLILPIDTLKSLLKQLSRSGYFDPGNSEWRNHQFEVLRLFVWERDLNSETCCMIIDIFAQALPLAQNQDSEHFHVIVLRLLNDIEDQLSLPVINQLTKFAVALWDKWPPLHMEEILARFWPLLNVRDMTSEGEPQAWSAELKLNTVSLPFVELFLSYLPKYPHQTTDIYDFMIEISKAHDLPPSVRIPVLRLLARLRCDSFGRIFVAEVSDSLSLASTLSRTEATIGPAGRYSLDRTSLHDDLPPSRSGRASGKLNLRTTSGHDRGARALPTPPLWMYPGAPGLPQEPPKHPSAVLFTHTASRPGLKLSEWLIVVIDILQQGGHWEVYSYVLVHLPSQLSNPSLFADAAPHIKLLRNVIVSLLQNGNFQEPPSNTNVSRGDVALCLYYSLTMLLAYNELFARGEQDEIIRTFLTGIGNWDRTGKTCIQSLAVCCHQMPGSITRALPGIVQKMSQIITQSNLAIDILEFLGGLARLPELYSNFREEEFRTVFAVCVKYLEHAREQRQRLPTSITSEADYNSNRLSGVSTKSSATSESGHNVDVHRDLPQYVFALAYHVITIWFLSLKLVDRSNHVGWITANLAWKDPDGNEYMEEQSQVTLDMMHRVAYLDLGESTPNAPFQPADGAVLKKTWIVGLSLITIETAVGSGLTQITKRQASGTTYASYKAHTSPLPSHHVPMPDDTSSAMLGPESRINVFPNHVFLQLTSTIAPNPAPMEPICLPDDDMVKRAISAFDRNDTVDGYKVGVVYVGNGQREEAEILANDQGSKAFETFLEGLGTIVPLRGAGFNTQGLDREEGVDGSHTYAWRDRVAEIVYHVPTMMPTDLEHDPACVAKKRHIGNDFVNIIFNESGLPFKFDTFPSQFNCVNIVIAPEDRPAPADEEAVIRDEYRSPEDVLKTFYTIQTVSHPSFPLISPAASCKLLPLANLPNLARQLALQCSVFSNVWTNRAGGEVISSWRNRLREIHKLRERYANTGTSTSAKFPGAKGNKTYAPGDTFKGRVEMGGLAEEEGVIAGLDFSRWAGPNPPLS